MESSSMLGHLVFQHLVAMPGFDCVFCSTQEKNSGRTKLFLIFDRRKQVYRRNALKETWDEIKDEKESEFIRGKCDVALREQKIPCYRT